MAIKWRFKSYLATKHGIYTLTDLRKKIAKETGVIISIQNLSNYVNKRPKAIPLETMEIICSALNCSLNDFFEIHPKKYKRRVNKKLAYKKTPHSKKSELNFPDPRDYVE